MFQLKRGIKASLYLDRQYDRHKQSIRHLEIQAHELSQPLQPSQMAALKSARRSYDGNLQRIRNHFVRGEREAVRRGIATVCHSHAAKLITAATAATSKGAQLTFDEILALVENIDLQKPCFEPATIRSEPKASGGFRIVQSFGVEATTRQMIARDLLVCSTRGSPFEYASVGRGRLNLSRSLRLSMEGGYRYWFEADINSFFASLRPKHFETLRLPKALKVYTLMSTTKTLIPSGTNEQDDVQGMLQVARLGLPEGAASSPYLASAFLGRELRAIEPEANVKLFTYMDNIIVGAREAEDLEAFAEALVGRFSSLTAGSLNIKLGPIEDLTETVRLLGWSFHIDPLPAEPTISMSPSGRSFYRLANRLAAKLTNCPADELWDAALQYMFPVSTNGTDLRL